MEGAAMEQTEEASEYPGVDTGKIHSGYPEMTHSSTDSPLNVRVQSLPHDRLLARRQSVGYESMMTDKSMNPPPLFRENVPQHQGVDEERAESVSSAHSKRSSKSFHNPLDVHKTIPFPQNESFHGEGRFPDYMPRNDRSMDIMPDVRFKVERWTTETEKKSCVSARSDLSQCLPTGAIGYSERHYVHSPRSDCSVDYGRMGPFVQERGQTEVTCDMCSDHKAVKMCLTCNAYYCEIDIKQHYTVPTLQRHQLVDVTSEVEAKRCQHYHRSLDFYCRSDQMPICYVCSDTTHRGHDIIINKTPDEEQCPSLTSVDELPPPSDFKIVPLRTDAVKLSWRPPDGLKGQGQFRVIWQCDGNQNSLIVKKMHQVEIGELKLGRKYEFAVATEKENVLSSWVKESFVTVIPPPQDVIVEHVNSVSATLRWTRVVGMDQVQQHFVILYHSPGKEPQMIHTTSFSKTLSDLIPDTEYTISVSTVLPDGEQSAPVIRTISTRSCLMELLTRIGLHNHYEDKLTLSSALEIKYSTTSDGPLETMQSLPEAFLKKLMIASVEARSVRCVTTDKATCIFDVDSDFSMEKESSNDNAINPLDLMTALFLCSDGSLHQEMVKKMAMCQFAVPLLLPNSETKQTTLMLWALRDVVKKFKPFTPTKPLVEESIVVSDIPLVSFVSLGKDSSSKYQIMNKILGNAFVHRDIDCDDAPRKISDGLVEVSWYLPSGNQKTDMFDKPLALANLRGDIRSFDKQFSFLCEVSASVYIFSDDYNGTLNALKAKNTKAELFLVMNTHNQRDMLQGSMRRRNTSDNIRPLKVIVRKKQCDADFVKAMQSSIDKTLGSIPNIVRVEDMAEVARSNGMLVDEDSIDCQKARRRADEITSKITDTLKFKEVHLPLHGIWKEEVSSFDKNKPSVCYQEKSEAFGKNQQGLVVTEAMNQFICAISGTQIERTYFLKWMQINLDNLSRRILSKLREEYKNLIQKSPEKKEQIANLDKKISDCSLGLEHFLRELGQVYQFYQSETSRSKNAPRNKQIENLPQIYAQMLLEGLPIELVNGDTSDIPLGWITDVLTCVSTLVGSNSKVKVVTVLGVQGTGKSTLLNTMFGVQFAVSVGRCTRGAFMQLIKVDKELGEEMKCDFIMIIDTEGLKAPELVQQKDSNEHDNELAALVVGLSDVTIINMTMEAFAEIKDILQIVVCTFLGMKDVMKKPKCQFVHQHVLDTNADANVRERKKMLEELDEMTMAAAKLENKDNITKFTDIMECNPDTCSFYIPGLWHGTPPMAPVSTGYSEAVYDFKKRLMQEFAKLPRTDKLTDFVELLKNLRDSVKYENSFHLRNRVCAAYTNWECTFNKEVESWMENAEKKIGEFDNKDLKSSKEDWLREADKVLELAEKKLLGRLDKYLEEQDRCVGLVEKCKETFLSKAKKLRQETEGKVRNKLQKAFESKETNEKADNLKSSKAHLLEMKIMEFLSHCREHQTTSSEITLRQEFEKFWAKAVSEINFQQFPKKDIVQDVSIVLRENLSQQRNINCMVDVTALENCWRKPFIVDSGNWKKMAIGLLKHGSQDYHKKKLQDFCDSIIAMSEAFIEEKVVGESDCCDAYIQDLLKKVDTLIQQQRKLELCEETEVSLKQHICGIAATKFQVMHDDFIARNDPHLFLEKSKNRYLEDFLDLFYNRNPCEKKAKDFVQFCLLPAVMDYVDKSTCSDIVKQESSGRNDHSTQEALTNLILEDLLKQSDRLSTDYENYRQYIHNYESYVKSWLLKYLHRKLKTNPFLERFQKKNLVDVVRMIRNSISKAKQSASTTKDIKAFIQIICIDLGESLNFPSNALDSVRILDIAYEDQFADELSKCVGEMQQRLTTELSSSRDSREKLRLLLFKPHCQLFKRLFGCMEQCPLCKAPCEAGMEKHTEHHSSSHRPQGLSGLKASNMLSMGTCFPQGIQTSRNSLSSNSSQLSRNPHMLYLNWDLARGFTGEASDYWKHVMVLLNEKIAKDCGALPARIPDCWKLITHKKALGSLSTR